MSADVVKLRVGGREYGGWKTARVTVGIEALSGSFSLGVSERWAGQEQAWPISEGDACTVVLNGESVLTGYLDAREASFEGVAVEGRDRAADLVDSSAVLDHWEFKGFSVDQIARKICEPFGISVTVQPGLVFTAQQKFSVDPGDTAANALENVCRLAGVLAVSDGRGGVLLTRAGSERCVVDLVQGQNLLPGARARFEMTGRFRTYRVLGQHRGSDSLSGPSAAAVKGEASDLGVTRPERVLLIRPEGNVTAAQAKQRAEWEAIVRAARGDTLTVPVQGWTQGDKARTRWQPNKLVRVRAPRLGVSDADMLITQVVYSVDRNGGTTAELSLKRPGAFIPQPTLAAPSGDSRWPEIRLGALT